MRSRRLALLVFTTLAACGGSVAPKAPAKYSLTGVAQKGPFVLGSQITVSELDAMLTPTGRTFMTQIADDTGAFSLPNVELASPFVTLTANGFYFDEVAGSLSTSEIQLGAIADVSNLSTVNANLMSDLEKSRVLKLIGDGQSLSDSKDQAQRELLAIFGITGNVAPAETLNIANGSSDDTALLAVSVILQSRRTPAELTELLAQLSGDFAPDGKLDDDSLGVKLAVGAERVDLDAVRTHLAARYQQLGSSATIGDFESVVRSFIATTPFLPAGTITYPETGLDGDNALAADVTTLPISPLLFSIAANVPVGKRVRVHVHATGVFLSSSADPAQWVFGATQSSEQDFDLTAEASETASVRDVSVSGDTDLGSDTHSMTIDFYENDATAPTRSKSVSFQ